MSPTASRQAKQRARDPVLHLAAWSGCSFLSLWRLRNETEELLALTNRRCSARDYPSRLCNQVPWGGGTSIRSRSDGQPEIWTTPISPIHTNSTSIIPFRA